MHLQKRAKNPLSFVRIFNNIPEKGGTKASSRQTSVSFSGGRRGTRHMVGSFRVSGAADARGYVMVIEGAEKQAGRPWDKFGNYEKSSEREMRYVVSWCRSSSLTRQWHAFVTRRKACILWKLEGDISVSEREIPSGFEWWDTTRARAQEDLLHTERRRSRARASTACV